MINRKWISNLVEPRKEGALSQAYDYMMIVAFFVILVTAIIIFQSEHEIAPVTGEYIFKNFYDAFYWATITLTTVGYGDLHPVSNLGKTLSIISSLFGIATIALPSSIITAGYMQELNRRVKSKTQNDNAPPLTS
jgi:voltage-gated potassium channel